jgi:hypothetical protein
MGVSKTEFPKFNKPELSVERLWSAPLGAASPLWLAFVGAAGAGICYWWMTRWMRPTNIEAASPKSEPALIPAAPTAEEAAPASVIAAEVVQADEAFAESEGLVEPPPLELAVKSGAVKSAKPKPAAPAPKPALAEPLIAEPAAALAPPEAAKPAPVPKPKAPKAAAAPKASPEIAAAPSTTTPRPGRKPRAKV